MRWETTAFFASHYVTQTQRYFDQLATDIAHKGQESRG